MFKKRKVRPSDASEEQLLNGCIKGDKLFQEEFYKRYASKMLSVCARYCKNIDEAQDILHEGFIKIFNNLDRFEGKGALEGWIRRIIVNSALENFRKNKKLNKVDELDQANELATTSGAIEAMSADDLLNMISKLPAGFKVVFNMYAIEGYSHKEIAEQLGITIGTSKSQLSRARAALQSMIQKRDLETYEQYQRTNR